MELDKHVSENCSDRISSLPDELLVCILSLLPTRCAVRTSILSRRWRYLFTLTTCLSFDDTSFLGQPDTDESVESSGRFTEFVDRVLELHQISLIHKFSLVCNATYDASVLNRWFSFALQKGVQELRCHLPDGFFMCETLASLKMTSNRLYQFEIPRLAWLPKLKVLHLDYIVFVDFNFLERLFSSCQLLEELTLKLCESDCDCHFIHRTEMLKVLTIEHCWFELGTFEIDAPNLVYLTYSSNFGVNIVPSWKHSCSLVRAELTFRCTIFQASDTNKNLVTYNRELLKAAAYKTTKLCFATDSVEFILMLGEDEQMPDFPSLSRLNIGNIPYEAWQYVTSLIVKSPKLETIVFESGFSCCSASYCLYGDCECDCDSLSPSDIPLVPFSSQVQSIEVHNFYGRKVWMSLMGHLLRNMSVLKRLIVYTNQYLDIESELKMNMDLLMLPRASTDCCIEMKTCFERTVFRVK